VTWEVARHRETPATFHARALGDAPVRSIWVCEPTGPALVLGSAQRDTDVDQAACGRAGIPVVRRRSGGGAVLVEPGDLLWLDAILPAGDPLWRDDVGKAFLWLGDVWRRALADVGVAAVVHDGPLVRGPWSSLVCFAGLGPGELTTPAGAKVVGISQRRTRAGARFQCAALLRWDPAALLGLLALVEPARTEARQALATAAAAAPVGAEPLLDAFLHHLP
jgi:lipoate-protein ligase A